MVVRHRTAHAFLDRSEAWLLGAEDRNNLILSLSYEVADEEDGDASASGAGPAGPFFATAEEGGRLVGCAFRTPPHQVLLTDMPPAAAMELARRVTGIYPAIPAVLGPESLAGAFAREWTALTGASCRPGTSQRLYRLDEVRLLPAPGRLRRARPEERALATEWADAFSRDVHTRFGPGEERIAGWVARGCVFVWEDDGEPVSMAIAHGRTPSGVRIGYVYTPPERRRRGYAGACVAELSRRLLEADSDFCVLYADLSNPTTNALYQRMGYRPLIDIRDFHFDAEATT